MTPSFAQSLARAPRPGSPTFSFPRVFPYCNWLTIPRFVALEPWLRQNRQESKTTEMCQRNYTPIPKPFADRDSVRRGSKLKEDESG